MGQEKTVFWHILSRVNQQENKVLHENLFSYTKKIQIKNNFFMQ